jgi:hypothetical protein
MYNSGVKGKNNTNNGSAIMTKSSVKLTRKIRNDFAVWSTGSEHGGYYPTKGHAVNTFDGALQDHGLCFDREQIYGFDGNDGRKNLDVVDEFGHFVGCALLSWYRMPSGRYEFIGYLA